MRHGIGSDEAASLTAAPATAASVIRGRAVTPVFQPIVDLTDGRPIGFEALSRGPADGPLTQPDALFAAARGAGLLDELDQLCRARAAETALAAGLTAPSTLFLNVEPATVGGEVGPPPALEALRDRGVRVVLELTERDLTRDPARLLAFAQVVRGQGFHIALDDVGADPCSLALMPFLRPEVVKLDLRLVQAGPGPAAAEIMSAVAAYAERTGALVVAEGVETPTHVAAARGLGAGLGQGWYFGRPRPTPDSGAVASAALPPRPPSTRRGAPDSAFDLVARHRATRRASKALLVEVSRQLERQAAGMGGLAVVLSSYEEADNLTPGTRRRYARLARRAAFVAVIGKDVEPEPCPGVRGASIGANDPLRWEWDVAVVGPHFAASLVARDLDGGDDPERSFDYVLTHDRTLVLEVARSMMARVVPRWVDAPVVLSS